MAEKKTQSPAAERLRPHLVRYAQAKQELQGLGFVLLGSVQARYQVCGKAQCRCARDRAQRHGPYYYWTRKVKGKTVSVLLTEEEFALYRQCIANTRALTRIVRTLQGISKRALAIQTGRKVR